MGILTDLTPAIFELDGTKLYAKVLSIRDSAIIAKEALVESGCKERGAELDELVTKALDDFDYPVQTIESILYACLKDGTKGLDKGDIDVLTLPINRGLAYRIFKYAIYGVFDDGTAKKKKATRTRNRQKAKKRPVKKQKK